MTPEEMQKNSAKKVQQVLDLMKVLHLRVEAKEKIDMRSGFIDRTVFWVDDENYPTAEVVGDPNSTTLTPPSDEKKAA